MLGRLIVGAIVWLAAAALLAVGLEQSARPRADRPRWMVTHRTAYHDVLLIEATARRDVPALDVAAGIIDAIRPNRYTEILVYVHHRTGWGRTSLRRVQWTRAGGYQELLIRE